MAAPPTGEDLGADAERVEAAGGPSKLLSGMAIATIEVAPDPSLGVGDCVVDADFGSIDGRLETRYQELRRVVEDAMAAEEGR